MSMLPVRYRTGIGVEKREKWVLIPILNTSVRYRYGTSVLLVNTGTKKTGKVGIGTSTEYIRYNSVPIHRTNDHP
ncbi:hypothetical protein Hanom_Chr08g00690271 [Helianthus anomalus]